MDSGLELRWDVTSSDTAWDAHRQYTAMAVDRLGITRVVETYCADCHSRGGRSVAIFYYDYGVDRVTTQSTRVEDLVGLKHFVGGGMEAI